MLMRKRSMDAIFLAMVAILMMATPAMSQMKQDPKTVKAKAPAPQTGTPPAASPKAPDPAMEKLLLDWEQKSSLIKSLSVKYKRTDVSNLFNRETYYEGQAFLKSPNLAYLDFYEVKPAEPPPAAKPGAAKPANPAPKRSFDERIVTDGKKVYQFKGPTRQVFIFPLPKDERQKALEEGPLPFLFNMSVKKAKERYQMTLEREDAVSYMIRIVPLLEIDKGEYSQAMVRLDKKQLLPMAIKLWAPQGKDTKLFTFDPSDLVANAEVLDSFFDGQAMIYGPKGVTKLKPPWTVEVNPNVAINPKGDVNAVPAGRAGTAKPAMKAADGRRN